MKHAVAVLFLLAALPATAADVMKHFDTVKVADGVLAFIAAEPKSGLVNGNCVAVIGDDGVLVVDTGQFAPLTRRMIAEIRKHTDKPVRYVVNTHWHWDHNLANNAYADAFPGVAIVSTPFTRQMLLDSTPKFLEFFKTSGAKFIEQSKASLASGKKRDGTPMSDQDKQSLADFIADAENGVPELQKAVFVPPNQTFDQSLTVYLGKREVRILFLGKGNTAGDAVVYVPDAKVLVTGDLVVHPTPYATHAHFRDWIESMKKLMAFEVTAIVPGHGPVQRDKSYMQTVTSLLESLVAQVGKAVQDGLTLEETRKRVDLESFRKQFAGEDWRRSRAFDEYFLVPAVTDAWKQARGEPTIEAPF
jgi:cyclase